MTRKKSFLISIDTEGDNQWGWRLGDAVRTDNARYLPRFQNLCEEYGFIPTYLTNYEMANDAFFVEFFGKKQDEKLCEIGMHLHAWNNPPDYPLPVRLDAPPGAPFLIEYPYDIMDEKIAVITNMLKSKFGRHPMVHRSGRWAINDSYFSLLDKYGYKVDCSVTPGVDWSKACGQTPGSHGSNYTRALTSPYYTSSGILEIPMTIRENHRLLRNPGEGMKKWLRNHWRAFRGQGKIWLRPNGNNLEDMLYLAQIIAYSSADDYLMFMIHSSELMPGGKGNSTLESIDILYDDIRILFKRVTELGFAGNDFASFAHSI